MKISRFSVQHPVIIGMILMALAVFGLVSIYDVNIEFMSDINIPQVYVISIYPGASSQDIEETVIDVMEDNFVTLEGFSSMESQASNSVGVVILSFQEGIDPYDMIVNNIDSLEITVIDESRGISSSASVVSYAPYVDPLSRSFNLRLRLDDSSLFTIGSAVNVRIVYESIEDVYTLPAAVLRLDNSLYYVEDGIARHMEYTPLYKNDELFNAPEGMEDVLFVIEGQNSLFDGQEVRILEDSGENI